MVSDAITHFLNCLLTEEKEASREEVRRGRGQGEEGRGMGQGEGHQGTQGTKKGIILVLSALQQPLTNGHARKKRNKKKSRGQKGGGRGVV